MSNELYGYQDSNDVAAGSADGRFGLNTGVKLTAFGYNPNGGKDESEQDAIDITFTIGDRDYNYRQFPVTKVFGKNGEITDTTSEEYAKAQKEAVSQLNAVLSDIVKCFVSEDDIKQALGQPIANFADYAKILERLVKSNSNWDKMSLDLFLQYQWSPKGDNDKSYLEVPKNAKHGKFVCPSVDTKWTEDRTESHLRYVNEAGEEHPFKRGQWFVDSAFANQTIVNSTADDVLENAGGGQASTW